MKSKRGRPKMGKNASIHTNCKSYVKTFIRKIGKGNLSMGLEILVDSVKDKAKAEKLEIKSEQVS